MPSHRLHFRVYAKTPELAEILERLEDLTPKLTAKIDFPFSAVVEPKPDHVVMEVFGLAHV